MRRIVYIVRVLLSHWARKPGQAAMFLVSLAAATALFSGVQALNLQARESYDRAATQLRGDAYETLAAPGGAAIPQADFVALRRAGWPVSPIVEGVVRVDDRRLRVIGVDPLTLPARPDALNGVQGDATGDMTPADFLLPPHVGLVSQETLALFDDGPRATDDGAALPPFRLAEGIAPYAVVTDVAAAQALLEMDGGFTRLALGAVDESRLTPIAEIVSTPLDRRAPQSMTDAAQLTGSFHLNLTAFGLLSFLVGLLIVYAAVGLAFEQRVGMVRTLRAGGATRAELSAAMILELIVLAALAGGAGTALGYLFAAAIVPDVAATLRSLYGADVAGVLSVRPAWWALGLAISVVGALGAAAGSLYKAHRLPVLSPAQPFAWRAAGRRAMGWSLALAAAFALVALVSGAAFGGLFAGFVLMGATLIAAALALPAVLSAALAVGESRARGALAQWFWADARQQLPSLAFSLQALLIALATNIGVGAMVTSFRDTFTGWLDQRLAAELYVRAGDDETASLVRAFLEADEAVSITLPFGFVETRIADAPVDVVGFTDHATYRDNWPLIVRAPETWDSVAAGEGVLINEQLFRARSLAIGDPMTLPTPAGPWATQVAGVYSDYGNPRGQILAARAAVGARWPDAAFDHLLVRAEKDAVPRLAGAVAERFAFDDDAIIEQDALKAFSLDVFERTFSVTAALNVLTLAIAGVAMFAGLAALAAARLPQLAPLWAMGLTRPKLAALDFAKTVGLSAGTAVVAAPLGMLVAWILTAVINVDAFGWLLPVRAYPGQWAGLVALAVAVAALASLPGLVSLRRTPPGALLKVFADER
ncbi:MAG: FtsX-like permease family protein [Pseudomonadota bacterium]